MFCDESDFFSVIIFNRYFKMIYRMVYFLVLNFIMFFVVFVVVLKLILGMKLFFVKFGLVGKDMNKKDSKEMM